jgi:RNA polymerase sigma-70 factor, ECF subfamily
VAVEDKNTCSITITEADFIRKAQAGDGSAYEELYKIHYQKTYQLISRLCGNSDDAEDLTQDVFLRLWTKIGKFSFKAEFKTWLYRMACNVTLSAMASQGRIRFKEQPLEDISEPSDTGQPPCPLERNERLAWLDAALLSLPEEERVVIVLHDLQEMSYADITDVLKVSPSSLAQRRHAGLEKLRLLRQKGSYR